MFRSRTVALVAIAASLLSTASASAGSDDAPAKVPKELQGVWKLMSIEVDGMVRDPIGGEPRWIIKGDKVFYAGEELARLAADPSTTPKVIDLKMKDPERVYEGIYAIEKDTLKVCLNKRSDGPKNRPSKLATKDEADWVMLNFEHEKAAPAKATEGLAGFVGIAIRTGENQEVVVDSPIKGSPAEKAGLKKGDVVLKVGTVAASDLQTTIKAVREVKPGAKLEIRINRDGKESTITATVGPFPFQYVVGLE
jgi:uncharacterized protein (TIGR03067 family)